MLDDHSVCFRLRKKYLTSGTWLELASGTSEIGETGAREELSGRDWYRAASSSVEAGIVRARQQSRLCRSWGNDRGRCRSWSWGRGWSNGRSRRRGRHWSGCGIASCVVWEGADSNVTGATSETEVTIAKRSNSVRRTHSLHAVERPTYCT